MVEKVSGTRAVHYHSDTTSDCCEHGGGMVRESPAGDSRHWLPLCCDALQHLARVYGVDACECMCGDAITCALSEVTCEVCWLRAKAQLEIVLAESSL